MLDALASEFVPLASNEIERVRVFDRITATFANKPSAMLSPSLLDRNFPLADRAFRGETHHP